MSDGLQFYTGITLVDITATGVTRFRPEQEFERNQQRNWETVIQTLGLRTQPLHLQEPVCRTLFIDDWEDGFGEMYSGEHKVWMFTWAVDREDIFLVGNDPIGGLVKDFEQVPIINGLSETANFILPIFHPYGAIKNIFFMDRALDLQ